MLQCILIAGTVFLSDGETIVRESLILDYRYTVDFSGKHLRASTGDRTDAYFDVPERLQRDSTAEVVAACLAEAGPVAAETGT